MLWVLPEDEHLQARLMVCVHMEAMGHRRTAATLHVLRPFCVWNSTETDVATSFVIVTITVGCCDGTSTGR